MREIRDKLETELKSLERELRIELPKEIKTALAMGDLRENAEYHAALERQGFVRARIGQLRQRLGELGAAYGDEQDYEPGRRVYFTDPDGIEVELMEYETAPV